MKYLKFTLFLALTLCLASTQFVTAQVEEETEEIEEEKIEVEKEKVETKTIQTQASETVILPKAEDKETDLKRLVTEGTKEKVLDLEEEDDNDD